MGRGGGGEVHAVRDRLDGRLVALKTLAPFASEHEAEALVREAVALEGLDGLGLPRILHFGRLPQSQKPYIVRELAEGKSLAELFADKAPLRFCLDAIARALDKLTILHRASLLHGDIKPANIIVADDLRTTLVDLGLVAPFHEKGARPRGITPRYAAPELLEGAPLSVRAEIYSLGATLAEALEHADGGLSAKKVRELFAIAKRAMAIDPSQRFPSADELASELRRVARLSPPEEPSHAEAWPIVGIDRTARRLVEAIRSLEKGQVLVLEGPKGSGRTTLLRRAAWSLALQGLRVAWLEEGDVADGEKDFVFADDADRLDEGAKAHLERAHEASARLVLVAENRHAITPAALGFSVPPLEDDVVKGLLVRSIPSLPASLIEQVIARTGARPEALRRLVRRLDGKAMVGASDLDRALGAEKARRDDGSPLASALRLLDLGRFDEAAAELDRLANDGSLLVSVARARLALGRGDAQAALAELALSEREAAGNAHPDAALWRLTKARAHLRRGEYGEIEALVELAGEADDPAIRAEALTLRGLAKSYLDEHELARRHLETSVEMAREAKNPRIESLALASLAFAHQRSDAPKEAREAYERALEAAERAEDASTIATIRLNLAVLAQGQGDIAETIAHLEAAIDMGERAGKRSTVQQARANLANLEIHLGRHARARASIDALSEEGESLPKVAQAQLLGLRAFLAARTEAFDEACELFDACGKAYEALGRGLDAAEAWLEGVVVAARSPSADVSALAAQLERAKEALGDAAAHRALRLLAEGSVQMLRGDRALARTRFDEALEAAERGGKKEWIFRALEARAHFAAEAGKLFAARRDGEQALVVLEEMAAELPRDLREVFWDDPQRKRLREQMVGATLTFETPSPKPRQDDRLARILEINRKLAREHDLGRLVEQITDHAVALLEADHGFVLLTNDEGELVVQASRNRGGDDPRARFSRSIAERVISSGEPVVSVSAREDARLAGYASVHQMALQSVACAPIRSPAGHPIGALYLETRVRPAVEFAKELPTLSALADQVAIAIENARLVTESEARAKELAEANRKLVAATQKLEELLGHRKAQLNQTRRDLRTTREALHSRFGFGGIVGRSDAIRRVFALIDRIKDTDIPVLITGESGTGKEMVARAIHEAGPRAKKPFIAVNCGAIPEHLLESELFGHVRGAFTGADRDRKGLFRESEGGTILLDEIGEMPQKMQAGLLRVLQEKLVRPVGGARELPVDVRVIAATNRELERMVRESSFREDLFYRLNVVEVRLPPLRERAEDIPLLVDHFLGIFAARFRRERRSLSREAVRLLMAYPWPGNVRQLENALLNAWITSDGSELGPDDFDLPDMTAQPKPEPSIPSPPLPMPPRSKNLAAFREAEKARILQALEQANWNRVKASELLGMPRRTLYRRLKEYGIQ